MASHKPIPTLSESQQHEFWEHVAVDMVDSDACWPWKFALKRSGYGYVSLGGNDYRAHRVAYEIVRGAIPQGLTLDHLCRNRACCNPAHLEPVSHRANVLRGESQPATNAVKTHCAHGHEYTAENTKINRWNRRVCLQCYTEKLAQRRRDRLVRGARPRRRLS